MKNYGYTVSRSALNRLGHGKASFPATLGSFGYKVCYREDGKKRYVCYFKTYTLKQAVRVMDGYIRYPPCLRGSGRALNKPSWKIIPISRKEIKAGIWREPPFDP